MLYFRKIQFLYKSILLAGTGAGIGIVFAGLMQSVSRNPHLIKQLFTYVILGFALTEAIALFGLMMAFLFNTRLFSRLINNILKNHRFSYVYMALPISQVNESHSVGLLYFAMGCVGIMGASSMYNYYTKKGINEYELLVIPKSKSELLAISKSNGDYWALPKTNVERLAMSKAKNQFSVTHNFSQPEVALASTSSPASQPEVTISGISLETKISDIILFEYVCSKLYSKNSSNPLEAVGINKQEVLSKLEQIFKTYPDKFDFNLLSQRQVYRLIKVIAKKYESHDQYVAQVEDCLNHIVRSQTLKYSELNGYYKYLVLNKSYSFKRETIEYLLSYKRSLSLFDEIGTTCTAVEAMEYDKADEFLNDLQCEPLNIQGARSLVKQLDVGVAHLNNELILTNQPFGISYFFLTPIDFLNLTSAMETKNINAINQIKASLVSEYSQNSDLFETFQKAYPIKSFSGILQSDSDLLLSNNCIDVERLEPLCESIDLTVVSDKGFLGGISYLFYELFILCGLL